LSPNLKPIPVANLSKKTEGLSLKEASQYAVKLIASIFHFLRLTIRAGNWGLSMGHFNSMEVCLEVLVAVKQPSLETHIKVLPLCQLVFMTF
jgi:hypothetical protein